MNIKTTHDDLLKEYKEYESKFEVIDKHPLKSHSVPVIRKQNSLKLKTCYDYFKVSKKAPSNLPSTNPVFKISK